MVPWFAMHCVTWNLNQRERHPNRRIVGKRIIVSPLVPLALQDAPLMLKVNIMADPMRYEESG